MIPPVGQPRPWVDGSAEDRAEWSRYEELNDRCNREYDRVLELGDRWHRSRLMTADYQLVLRKRAWDRKQAAARRAAWTPEQLEAKRAQHREYIRTRRSQHREYNLIRRRVA